MSDTISDYIVDGLGRAILIATVLVFLAGFALGIFAAVAYSRFAAPAPAIVEGRPE